MAIDAFNPDLPKEMNASDLFALCIHEGKRSDQGHTRTPETIYAEHLLPSRGDTGQLERVVD